jgi:hypothetical protein
MAQQEQKQRDWIYLLPGGQSAENMKVGRLILSEQSGHNFSSESFRSLVKKGVIKKITRFDDSITPLSDANNNTIPTL